MGYLQLGPGNKKGKIPYITIPLHLPSLKTAPTHGLIAGSLSFAALPTTPLAGIQ